MVGDEDKKGIMKHTTSRNTTVFQIPKRSLSAVVAQWETSALWTKAWRKMRGQVQLVSRFKKKEVSIATSF